MTEIDDGRQARLPMDAATAEPALMDGPPARPGEVPDTFTEAIVAALRTVHDPEIPVNIYDLGLIYRIAPDGAGGVEIDMTLTAPGCPVAGEMVSWVQTAVSNVAGIGAVKVKLVFDPPWESARMSDEVKLELGLL